MMWLLERASRVIPRDCNNCDLLLKMSVMSDLRLYIIVLYAFNDVCMDDVCIDVYVCIDFGCNVVMRGRHLTMTRLLMCSELVNVADMEQAYQDAVH